MTFHDDGPADICTPDFVRRRVEEFDDRVDEFRQQWAEIDAAIATEWWYWFLSGRPGEEGELTRDSVRRELSLIETNRLKPKIDSVVASLVTERREAEFKKQSTSRADPEIAALAANQWSDQDGVQSVIEEATRIALCFDWSGIKVGNDEADGRSAISRTWTRAIPPWGLLTDWDAENRDDARFIGHIYYEQLDKVLERWGAQLMEKGVTEDKIKTRARDGFLDGLSTRVSTQPNSGQSGSGKADLENTDDARWVRVLEFLNYEDQVALDMPDGEQRVFQGRLEVYILDQEGPLREPIYQGPMTYAPPGMDFVPNIIPVVHDHRPGYPFRGLGYARQLMPQIRELNGWRTWMSQASRKNIRVYMTLKGLLDPTNKQSLEKGEDGLVLEFDAKMLEELRMKPKDALIPLDHGEVGSTVLGHINAVERDLSESEAPITPTSMGVATNATAFEVGVIQKRTETLMGRLAKGQDRAMEQTFRCGVLALAFAMRVPVAHDGGKDEGEDYGDASEFAREIQDGTPDPLLDDALAAEQALEVELEERADEEQAAAAAPDDDGDGDDTAGDPIFDMIEEELDDADPAELEVVAMLAGEQPGGRRDGDETPGDFTAEDIDEIEPMFLSADDDTLIEVRPEHLEAVWVVTFQETGRTPGQDARRKQALLELGEPYANLWKQAQAPGPEGVFARVMMEEVHGLFDLPPAMHPARLDARLRKTEGEKASDKAVDAADAAGQDMPDEAGVAPGVQPDPAAGPVPPGGQAGDAPPPPPGPGGDQEARVQLLMKAREHAASDPHAVIEALLSGAFQGDPTLQQLLQVPPQQAGPALIQLIDQTLSQLGGQAPAAPQPV